MTSPSEDQALPNTEGDLSSKTEQDIDIEKHKHEIASLRRLNSRFVSLRNWLANTCLASLAFVVTVLLQVRLQGALPSDLIAEAALVLLTISVLSSMYAKFSFEASNMISDVKDLAPLYPVLIELAKKSEDATDEQKLQFIALLENMQARTANTSNEISKFEPFAELIYFIITSVALFLGLSVFFVFVWIYLF